MGGLPFLLSQHALVEMCSKRPFLLLIHSSISSSILKAKSLFTLPSVNQRLKTCVIR